MGRWRNSSRGRGLIPALTATAVVIVLCAGVAGAVNLASGRGGEPGPTGGGRRRTRHGCGPRDPARHDNHAVDCGSHPDHPHSGIGRHDRAGPTDRARDDPRGGDAPNGWPTVLTPLPPNGGIGWTSTPATHAYAAPGTFTVTVTATSTGCDGSVPRRTTRPLHWTRS